MASKRYSPKGRLALQVLTVLSGLLLVACSAAGLAGTFRVNGPMTSGISQASKGAELQYAGAGSGGLAGNSAAGNDTRVSAFSAHSTTQVTQLRENSDNIKRYEYYRHYMLIIVFIICVIGALVTTLAPLIRSGPTSQMAMFLLFFTCGLLWIAFAIFLPFSISFADLCTSLRQANVEALSTSGAGANLSFVAPRELADTALALRPLPVLRAGSLYVMRCLDYNITAGYMAALSENFEANVALFNAAVSGAAVVAGVPEPNPNWNATSFNATLPWEPQAPAALATMSATFAVISQWAIVTGDTRGATYVRNMDTLRTKLGRTSDLWVAARGLLACEETEQEIAIVVNRSCDSSSSAYSLTMSAIFFAALLAIPAIPFTILGIKRFPKLRRRLKEDSASGAEALGAAAGGAAAGGAVLAISSSARKSTRGSHAELRDIEDPPTPPKDPNRFKAGLTPATAIATPTTPVLPQPALKNPEPRPELVAIPTSAPAPPLIMSPGGAKPQTQPQTPQSQPRQPSPPSAPVIKTPATLPLPPMMANNGRPVSPAPKNSNPSYEDKPGAQAAPPGVPAPPVPRPSSASRRPVTPKIQPLVTQPPPAGVPRPPSSGLPRPPSSSSTSPRSLPKPPALSPLSPFSQPVVPVTQAPASSQPPAPTLAAIPPLTQSAAAPAAAPAASAPPPAAKKPVVMMSMPGKPIQK
jgi:hypothetical protein